MRICALFSIFGLQRAVASEANLVADAPRRAGSWAEYYGALRTDSCFRELNKRGVAYARETKAAGVKMPLRLKGPLGGVIYRTDFPDAKRHSVPWEIFDCRVVLALHDFSRILRHHGFVEARIFSAWRPPPANWPETKWARRHPGGLAVDLREFRRPGGEALSVERSFAGRLGAKVCSSASTPNTDAALLRKIICTAADFHIFNVILTPNHDKQHFNHFHVEVTPGAKWFIVE